MASFNEDVSLSFMDMMRSDSFDLNEFFYEVCMFAKLLNREWAVS